MKTMDLIEQFEESLQKAYEREAAYLNEALQYDTRYHHAIAHSSGTNAEGRKADAVLQTADIAARKARLELEARIEWERVKLYQAIARRSE